MNNILLTLIAALSFGAVSLRAEIQQVSIFWTPQACLSNCTALLQKKLQQIPAVNSVSIDQLSGRATLQWDPEKKFSFIPINYAMRAVGPKAQLTTVKVRGMISQSGERFSIVSIGDNTRFELLSPIVSQKGRYAEQKSRYTRQLSAQQKAELLAIKKANQLVTIEGALFEPTRIPLNLVIERMSAEAKK